MKEIAIGHRQGVRITETIRQTVYIADPWFHRSRSIPHRPSGHELSRIPHSRDHIQRSYMVRVQHVWRRHYLPTVGNGSRKRNLLHRLNGSDTVRIIIFVILTNYCMNCFKIILFQCPLTCPPNRQHPGTYRQRQVGAVAHRWIVCLYCKYVFK